MKLQLTSLFVQDSPAELEATIHLSRALNRAELRRTETQGSSVHPDRLNRSSHSQSDLASSIQRSVTPSIAIPTLDPDQECRPSPSRRKKQQKESESHAQRGKAPTRINRINQSSSRDLTHASTQQSTLRDAFRLGFNGLAGDRLSESLDPHKPSTSAILRFVGLSRLQKYDPWYPEILFQPDSRPISQEQLTFRNRSVKTGVLYIHTNSMYPAPTISNDNIAQNALAWRRAPYRTLLHEHHDFFLASQHPSASPKLRRLVEKYTMARHMWQHGIHSFLKPLKHRLPDYTMPACMWKHVIHSVPGITSHRISGINPDDMHAFIYLSCTIMALKYETFLAFADTWIDRGHAPWAKFPTSFTTPAGIEPQREQGQRSNKPLEKLILITECRNGTQNKMQLPEKHRNHGLLWAENCAPTNSYDENLEDAVWKTWAGVTRSWYSKAAGGQDASVMDRLYHHLAILARLDSFRQLYHYSRSLTILDVLFRAREFVALYKHHFTGVQQLIAFMMLFLQGLIIWMNSLSRHITYRSVSVMLCVFRLPMVSGLPIDRDPILADETPFDYVVYGLMALYLIGMWFVGGKAKMYSFALMLAMAAIWAATVSNSFSAGLCKTYVKFIFTNFQVSILLTVFIGSSKLGLPPLSISWLRTALMLETRSCKYLHTSAE
jgi:hypothetical protein